MSSRRSKLTNVASAATIAVLQIGLAISLAALIFSGPLGEGAGRAASGFIFGTIVSSMIVGARTRMRVVVSGAQDTAAIMVAAVAASVARSDDLTQAELVPTAIMLVAICTIGTGLVFWALGHFGLSTFVRFLPYPVISGFMAGTGWLLLRGGVEVMHGEAIEFTDVADLLPWHSLKFLLPGLALGLVMTTVVSTRLNNAFASLAILGGMALFLVIGATFTSIDDLEANGWLIGPFADDGGWSPIRPSDFRDANWVELLDNAVAIAAVMVVSVIGLLLNLSGLEGAVDRRIDMNHEMRVAGIANVIGGAGSGLVGYHLLGDITLARQLGGRGRSVSFMIAATATVVLLIGPGLVGLVPRPVAGGVLAGLGLNLLVSWVRTSLPRMSRGDSVLSSMILAVIAIFGVLAGVGAGVVTAAAVFIVKYSRIDSVRHVIDAAGRSAVDRTDRDQRLLANASGSVLAFELQGYLFFGSTIRLRQLIDSELEAIREQKETRFVIIDFAHVTGIDSTAAVSLTGISNQLAERDIATVWSATHPEVERELRRDSLGTGETAADLDHAISWCEEQILASMSLPLVPSTESDTAPFDPQVMESLGLPTLELKPGETLISSGSSDRELYFVVSGRLTAWLVAEDGERQVRIRQVLPGAMLGEIAFCTGTPRTASVVADSDVTVYVLYRDRFDALVRDDPESAVAIQNDLLERMSHRVTTTSAMVRDLLR